MRRNSWVPRTVSLRPPSSLPPTLRVGMLGSLLEGAKATVRRAGAADPSEGEGRDAFKEPSSPPEPDGSLRDEGLHVQSPRHLAVGEQVTTASEGGAAGRDRDVSPSVSRSFSLLRASGARVRDDDVAGQSSLAGEL